MDAGITVTFIPIVALCAALCIPIVSILSKHQQKMAEIVHGRANREAESESQALRHEVAELRAQLSAVTLALDSVTQKQKAHGDEAIQQRLG